MKFQVIPVLSLAIILTAVNPAWAQGEDTSSVRTSIEESQPERLLDLPIRLNPQIGFSSFEHSGQGAGSSEGKLSGGLTVELGGEARQFETGLLLLQTGSNLSIDGNNSSISSSFLTIPMMAKIRLLSMRAQSWYAKFGAMTAFETSSDLDSETNDIDVIAALGMGGRFHLTQKTQLLVEATYNRGLIDSIREPGDNYNQGYLIMAGVSIGM